jgi:hypothetical protein
MHFCLTESHFFNRAECQVLLCFLVQIYFYKINLYIFSSLQGALMCALQLDVVLFTIMGPSLGHLA